MHKVCGDQMLDLLHVTVTLPEPDTATRTQLHGKQSILIKAAKLVIGQFLWNMWRWQAKTLKTVTHKHLRPELHQTPPPQHENYQVQTVQENCCPNRTQLGDKLTLQPRQQVHMTAIQAHEDLYVICVKSWYTLPLQQNQAAGK